MDSLANRFEGMVVGVIVLFELLLLLLIGLFFERGQPPRERLSQRLTQGSHRMK